MRYRLELSNTALRGLKRLPDKARAKVVRRFALLADDPRPVGSRDLKGKLEGFRRLRIGQYRLVYHVDDDEETVTALRIGPRGSVYR